MAEPADEFIARKSTELLARPVYARDIGGRGRLIWEREAVTLRQQSNYLEKVFMVERMKLVKVEGEQLREGGAKVGDREYRFGYYTVSRTDKWWWGQFSIFIPADDLEALLAQARREGTIL
jgi:hypothetical protein